MGGYNSLSFALSDSFFLVVLSGQEISFSVLQLRQGAFFSH